MEKHFMIDIETTGINPLFEDLLQIGILETEFDGTNWIPGREFELYQHTDRTPRSAFALEHMVELYEICNQSPLWNKEAMRWRVLKFLTDCGGLPPEICFMGWSASNFDLSFLAHEGVLRPSEYETDEEGKDRKIGDYSHRIYEIQGAVSLVQNKFPKNSRGEIIKAAKARDTIVKLPSRKEHDALYDCYSQLKILNGLIQLSRDYCL